MTRVSESCRSTDIASDLGIAVPNGHRDRAPIARCLDFKIRIERSSRLCFQGLSGDKYHRRCILYALCKNLPLVWDSINEVARDEFPHVVVDSYWPERAFKF